MIENDIKLEFLEKKRIAKESRQITIRNKISRLAWDWILIIAIASGIVGVIIRVIVTELNDLEAVLK